MRTARSKYGARKAVADGIVFASAKERDRYLFLRDAQARGEIGGLTLQPRYELVPAVREDAGAGLKAKAGTGGRVVQRAIHYVADFSYVRSSDGAEVVEDVKMGRDERSARRFLPRDYLLKRKMMLALLGIRVREVHSATEGV